MLEVFLEVVLPVALVALVGSIVGNWRKVPVQPLSQLVFYLFTPALVFYSLATTELSAGASIRIVLVAISTYAVMYVIANGYSFLRGHERSMRAGFALGAVTANTGNMGLPVSQLAFGAPGLEIAVMNFVAGSVLANSAGIAVASMAGGSGREALTAPLRFPALYAAALGVFINAFDIDLPVTLDAPAHSLADAAVPTMLVVLGLQLRHAAGTDYLADTFACNVLRLLVSPAVAFGTATLLGFGGETRGTLIVLAAMPTAVLATILATEFRAQQPFVTQMVVTSTICSMLTLSLLITLVR